MADRSNFLNLTLPETGEFPGEWALPVNANMNIIDALFGPVSGHTHNGAAGSGPRIPHANLLNAGSVSHALLDAHVVDTVLHKDTQISTVMNNAGTVAVFDVSELRFANATVSEVSPGVALVTPTGGPGGGTGDVDETAPVVYHDNFLGAAGTPLSAQGYIVTKSTPVSPNFVINGTAGTTGNGVVMGFNTADHPAGYCTNLVGCAVPHSRIQRVAVNVLENTPADVTTSDNWALWLHILATTRDTGSNSFSFPVEAGLSFVLSTKVVDNEVVLTPSFVVRRATDPNNPVTYITPFQAPSGWVNPDGSDFWNDLPLDYMNGCHEFSLSVTGSDRTAFTLNYYYNNGLIFRRVFTAADGAFHTAVTELLDDLKVTTAPPVPDFGRFGFSVTYDMVTTTDFVSNVNFVMASSIGEQIQQRVISVPATTGPPPPPPPNYVCDNTAPFVGTAIGGFFDPDASGPIGPMEWTVSYSFPAQGNQSKGFIISNASLTREIIYCQPGVATPPTNPCVKSRSTSIINLPGNNIPPGRFSKARFAAGSSNIPRNWEEGGGPGDFFTVGEELPGSFVEVNRITNGPTTTNGGSLNVEISTGTRLPWDAALTIFADPDYDPSFTYNVTWEGMFTVCPAPPVVVQVVPYVWRGTWLRITPERPVYDLETVLIFASGENLPLGSNFWLSGNSFGTGYSLADTAGAGGQSLEINSGPRETFTPLYDKIMTGQLNESVAEPVMGVPTSIVTPTTGDPGFTFQRVPDSSKELIVTLMTIDFGHWNGGNANDIKLRMREDITPNNFQDVTLLPGNHTCPALVGGGPDPNSPGTVWLLDPPIFTIRTVGTTMLPEFEFPTPVWSLPPGGNVKTPNDPEITLHSYDPVTSVGLWDIDLVTLNPAITPNTAITLIVREPITFDVEPTRGEALMQLGFFQSSGTTPIATYVSGSLIEDQTRSIVFSVDESTTEPDTTFQFSTAMREFFTIVSIDKTTGVLVGDLRPWTVEITTRDEVDGNVLPTQATIEFITPAVGLRTLIDNVPVFEATPPVIDTFELIELGSGITTMKANETGGYIAWLTATNAGSVRGLPTVTVTNYTGAGTIQIFDVTRRTETTFQMALNVDGILPGETFGITVGLPTLGDPLLDTLSEAITVAPGISFSPEESSFSTTHEGLYFTFDLVGDFPTAGTSVSVTFEDPSTVNMMHTSYPQPLINASGPGIISGTGRLANDTSGTQMIAVITLDEEVYTEKFNTNVFVTTAPAPAITTFTLVPNIEGSTGSIVTINGTFLKPVDAPAGFPGLSYGYTFIGSSEPLGVINTVLNQDSTSTRLSFTADIAADTAGQRVGITIDHLGGNEITFRNGPIIAADTTGSGGPEITSVSTTTAGEIGPSVGVTNVTTLVTLDGSGLGADNVLGPDAAPGIRLAVLEFENGLEATNLRETPPGQGIHPSIIKGYYSDVTIVSQSPAKIVFSVTMPEYMVDTRLQVELLRNEGHPDGGGVWDVGNVDGISSLADGTGLLISGPESPSLKVNAYPEQGATRHDFGLSFQNAIKPGKEGTTFSLLVRLDRALTKAPIILPIVDPVYGATIKNITVTGTASPFEWLIGGKVPQTSDLDSYPAQAMTPLWPVAIGLQFQNGIPLASGLVGAVDWDGNIEAIPEPL